MRGELRREPGRVSGVSDGVCVAGSRAALALLCKWSRGSFMRGDGAVDEPGNARLVGRVLRCLCTDADRTLESAPGPKGCQTASS